MFVINLLGEPGVGKTVTSHGMCYEMAINGFEVEGITEAAKAYAWETPTPENISPIFNQQILLLGEQNRMLERLIGKREVVINECPLIMSAVYCREDYFTHFVPLVLEQFNAYNNINILLERNHEFDKNGRIHNEAQALAVREKLIDLLHTHKIDYTAFKTSDNVHQRIIKHIQEHYFKDKMLKDYYNKI